MADASAITTVHAERRRRPVWVVAALSFLTLDIYGLIWFGLSWAELKRERNDPTMRPVWHVLSLFVPFYGLFRAHAHFRTLNELRATVGQKPGIPPGWAVISFILGAGAGRLAGLPFSPAVSLLFLTVSGALFALPIALGQRALNEYYGVLPVPTISAFAGWFEWVIMAIGTLIWLLIILGSLAPA